MDMASHYKKWMENEDEVERRGTAAGFSPHMRTPDMRALRAARRARSVVPPLEPLNRYPSGRSALVRARSHGRMEDGRTSVSEENDVQRQIVFTGKDTSNSLNRSHSALFDENAQSRWEHPSHWNPAGELKIRLSRTVPKMECSPNGENEQSQAEWQAFDPISLPSETDYWKELRSKTSVSPTSQSSSSIDVPSKHSKTCMWWNEPGLPLCMCCGATQELAKPQQQ